MSKKIIIILEFEKLLIPLHTKIEKTDRNDDIRICILVVAQLKIQKVVSRASPCEKSKSIAHLKGLPFLRQVFFLDGKSVKMMRDSSKNEEKTT